MIRTPARVKTRKQGSLGPVCADSIHGARRLFVVALDLGDGEVRNRYQETRRYWHSASFQSHFNKNAKADESAKFLIEYYKSILC